MEKGTGRRRQAGRHRNVAADTHPQSAGHSAQALNGSSRSFSNFELFEKTFCFKFKNCERKFETFETFASFEKPAGRRRPGSAEPAGFALPEKISKSFSKSFWNSKTFSEFESFFAACSSFEASAGPEGPTCTQDVHSSQVEGDTAMAFSLNFRRSAARARECKIALDTLQSWWRSISLRRLRPAAFKLLEPPGESADSEMWMQKAKEAQLWQWFLQSLGKRD
jgi:hypothetical protein